MPGARERDVAAAVAEQLRVLMARKKMRTLHLSKAAGIPNSTLSSILDGGRAIDVDQLARLCRQLDVEPGDVLSAALDSIRALLPEPPDMAVVDEVLAADTTLTPKQKASLREEAAGGYPLSGDSDPVVPQRRVL